MIGFNETRDVNRKSKVDMERGTRCDLHEEYYATSNISDSLGFSSVCSPPPFDKFYDQKEALKSRP